MDTRQIENVLRSDHLCSPLFAGVFASDAFAVAFRASDKRLFVINNQDSRQPGEHWLAVWRAPDVTYFFDSYGLPPHLYRDVYNTLTRPCSADLVGSTVRLQELGTDVCGQYCVAYCLAVSRGVPHEKFLAYWTKKDDSEVAKMVGERLLRIKDTTPSL